MATLPEKNVANLDASLEAWVCEELGQPVCRQVEPPAVTCLRAACYCRKSATAMQGEVQTLLPRLGFTRALQTKAPL